MHNPDFSKREWFALFALAAMLGVGIGYGACMAVDRIVSKESASEPTKNEQYAAQNAYCISVGMKPVYVDFNETIRCEPDEGKRTIKEFFSSQLGREIIREKLRQEGYTPRGIVNWPDNGQEPRIENFKPVNPNSFETLSKVTE